MKINLFQVDYPSHLTNMAKDIANLGGLIEDIYQYRDNIDLDVLQPRLESFGRVIKVYGQMIHNGLRAFEDVIDKKLSGPYEIRDGEVPKDELMVSETKNSSECLKVCA